LRATKLEFRAGDEVLSRPKKGKGASLTMRYRLPRNWLSDGDAFGMETWAAGP
jgi:hypothetical protein